MGLLRAAIFFLLGNFYISLIENNSEYIQKIDGIGQMFGINIHTFIQANKMTALVVLLSVTALLI